MAALSPPICEFGLKAIERRFREVRRRTRPMGVFQDRTSMDRILFAIFTHENATPGSACHLLPDTKQLTLPRVAVLLTGY